MVRKYVFGNPFETEAIVKEVEAEQGTPAYGEISLEEGFSFTYRLAEDDMVYGLGEANRGLNKRGYCYISDCTDDPEHTEDKRSLYGAHNLVVISGEQNVGLFFDYPSRLVFDIGYTREDTMKVSCEAADLYLYVIEGENAYDIVKQFRKLIGRSYIPPKFAFGLGQSRWGYKTREDFENVAKGYRENQIPLDMIYMDIDYMQDYKDFTLNEKEFSDFPDFVQGMKEQGIRLVPIIDAGVKMEEGYSVYEEGVKNNYFCKREDGSDFAAAVWPGYTHFPDVLNPEARKWFGDHYRDLIDQGIEGFWNDMNEPAIFYSKEGMEELKQTLRKCIEDDVEEIPVWLLGDKVAAMANNKEDYKRFYHNINGKKIRHDKVHNLFGYNMTRAAGEAFERIYPDRRFLMFSRSSYVGMHRYGGIWTGDNKSWWSHLLLNLKMMPSLNMCGFLYTGADLGGFGADTTRDLLLRWLALGVFTPLMRNHAAVETREQEPYQFERVEDFRGIIETRYRLIPYLYSEYMKAALEDDLYFKPLAFVYPEDSVALRVEDQMMIGNEIMIAPVYVQNARGRYVYLPEEMKFVKFSKEGAYTEQVLEKGHHYVEVALDEVPLFIRKDRCIPVAKAAQCVEKIDTTNLELLGYEGAEYTLFEDDGIHKDYENPANYKVLKK
ncbi:MAG: glycoside hydrolase family 31 protein [Lachnospiraceae bacterium]|nr:alpha-glucosidase [Lachnospiraceae bacterium]MDY4769852.1 glycoside hydrolase family 31 protein [Lachnospiraceae bacterium]